MTELHTHNHEYEDAERPVTPELVAETALDEADGPAGYDIPLEDIEEGAEEQEADPEPNAECIFLVVISPDGAAFATSEVQKIGEILPKREATIADMRRACQDVVHDINAQQTAMQTVSIMQQQAAAMAEQARSEKIAAKLAQKGIHVPRR